MFIEFFCAGTNMTENTILGIMRRYEIVIVNLEVGYDDKY